MRKLLALWLLLPAVASHSQNRIIQAETSIKGVTIFTAGAQVERTASVALLPGRSEITFSGLSNSLDPQSIQLKGDAAITLLSVQTTRDFFGQRKTEQEERILLERRSTLKERQEGDAKMLEVYRQEETMLVKNQAIGGQAGVKPAELKEALDLHRQRLTEVYTRQLEVSRRLKAAAEELTRLDAQIGEIGKKRDSTFYSVTALVESRGTRTVQFGLLYRVKEAGWFPSYDVRVADVAQPLEILMNAHVFQRSGETWKDVALLLSTGSPESNATRTELQPWKVGFYDPSVTYQRGGQKPGQVAGRVVNEEGHPIAGASVMIRGRSDATTTDNNGFFRLQTTAINPVGVISSVGFASREVVFSPGYFTIRLKVSAMHLDEVVVTGYSVSGLASGMEVAPPAVRQKAKEEEIQPVSVVTRQQPTAVVYAIDEPYTLETDGKTTTIGIKNSTVPALYEYFTAPKVDPSVFLTARIPDWQEYDLQPGEVNLYFEGTSLGKTYLDGNETDDTLSLSLGRDNSIRVSRKLVKETSATRLIGANRRETRQYEIVVRNMRRIAVALTVEDQFPISVNREIDVEDTEAPDAELNKETGIARWSLQLAPGMERKLRLRYSVKYPKDRKVMLE